MNPLINRVLAAYRPLYLRGLLMDGQYKWPSVDAQDDPLRPARQTRPRLLLAALTGLRHIVPSQRSKP
ncbi:hypothetical protein [Rhodanobacter sp. A1T4]|jgi:hypothetical protein|uniref:hypothetical protein n=1 Tax=Rhodanobacter sp. A1T4 TaxID=2723087 RepID=UPI00161DA5BD|nr:hypothetical protein [Rhodanobacter sp. A1T4]MBB6247454.1 hypothetical protein [Rhodanobacter sp. A1T4]